MGIGECKKKMERKAKIFTAAVLMVICSSGPGRKLMVIC